MAKHILCTLAILFLISIVLCHASSSIKNHPLYFNSYHYPLDYTHATTPNDNLLIHNQNIHVEWTDSSLLINHDIQLNWHTDQDWNDISFIHNKDTIINTRKARRLINEPPKYKEWNPWDHTTEHHKKEGRFIGESKYKRKYEDAAAMCHEYYAGLTSIRGAWDNEQVKELCSTLGGGSCWIGLQKNTKYDSWTSTKKWDDGHPLAYTNWAPGQPSENTPTATNEKCVEIYSSQYGYWSTIPCNKQRYAICEEETVHNVGEFIGIEKKATWYKGNLYCKMKYGSELATITEEFQQNYAKDACAAPVVGFDGQDCWIGLKKKVGLLWSWTGNNDIFTYQNWALNQPDSVDPKKQCGFLNVHTTTGVWENDHCSKQKWILCNSKEETVQTRMRDMMFPPTLQEQHEKEKLAQKQQEIEIEEKKTEKELAEIKAHGAASGVSRKGEQTHEDRSELRMDQEKKKIPHKEQELQKLSSPARPKKPRKEEIMEKIASRKRHEVPSPRMPRRASLKGRPNEKWDQEDLRSRMPRRASLFKNELGPPHELPFRESIEKLKMDEQKRGKEAHDELPFRESREKLKMDEQKRGNEAQDELRMVGEHIPLTGQEEMKDGKEAQEELRMAREHIPSTVRLNNKEGQEEMRAAMHKSISHGPATNPYNEEENELQRKMDQMLKQTQPNPSLPKSGFNPPPIPKNGFNPPLIPKSGFNPPPIPPLPPLPYEENEHELEPTQGKKPQGFMPMLQTMLRNLGSQPGEGVGGNLGVHIKDYDPEKDPYFGEINRQLMKQEKKVRAHVHKKKSEEKDKENEGKSKKESAMEKALLKHGGSLIPPSGDAENPYRFNPQFYPETQLPAPFAEAAHRGYKDSERGTRRLLIDRAYDEIEKCKMWSGFVFCVRYDVKQDKMKSLDVVVPDIMEMNQDEEEVHYFEDFEFLFEFNPYKASHKLCANYGLQFDICLERNMKKGNEMNADVVLMILEDGVDVSSEGFDFASVEDWDEIYGIVNRKCVHVTNDVKVCLMPIVDCTDYMIQIKSRKPS